MSEQISILFLGTDTQLKSALQAVLLALPGEGHGLLQAEDSTTAKVILDQQAPRLLVLATDAHDTSTADALNVLGSHPRIAQGHTGVLLLCELASASLVEELCRLPLHACLAAPCSVRSLQGALEALLQRQKQLGALFSGTQNLPANFYRRLVESSPDMVFLVDDEGCFSYVSERTSTLLGYQPENLLGSHFSSIVRPEDIDKAAVCFSERNSGVRSYSDDVVWLIPRSGFHTGHDTGKIAVELSAAGIYEEQMAGGKKKMYVGTCVVARDITARLDYEKIIQYQAYHDLLTGLPNRALFTDRLQTAINNAARDEVMLSIMFLDLDRFKLVNDSLGHAIGDLLLQEVSERLTSVLREADTVARFGGDEFMVLLPRLNSEQQAEVVSRKINAVMRRPFHINEHEIFMTISIGMAMYPRDGEDPETLIGHADIAMYHTKEQGRNNAYFFRNDMSVRNEQLLNIENDIRKGIHKQQFKVYYQPQIDVSSGHVSGIEALLRWQHPEKGLLTPAYFLAVAEESGMIIDLGQWMLDAALLEVQSWRHSGLEPGCLAVNFSAREIEQQDFVRKILGALKKHGFPPELLEVEVTENAIMNDIDGVIAKLQQLHNAGIRIAIDDFGTGYSSLSRLQNLPIDRLKIDQSFIRQLTLEAGRSMLEGIAYMARGLQLDMVAEGVEQDYQLSYLQKLKCKAAQGFIFSEGVPAMNARRFIQKVGPLIREQTRRV